MIELRKAHELDVVELTVDLPEYGVRRGARGTVVEVFDKPEEAYMIEFLENAGETSKIADCVTPEQIKNIDGIAKEHYIRGMSLLQKRKTLEAAREIRQAVNLIPNYVRELHNSLSIPLGRSENWPQLRQAMLFVRLIDPTYEHARYNLAISCLNDGTREANKGNYEEALRLFYSALRVESPLNIVSLIKDNIANSCTLLGIQAHQRGDLQLTVTRMEEAFTFGPNERTRHDLGVAYLLAANYYSDMRDSQKAIIYYRQVEDAGMILPEVLNNHACVLASTGEIDEAILYLESALALAPEDAVVRTNLDKLLGNETGLATMTAVDFFPVHLAAALAA